MHAGDRFGNYVLVERIAQGGMAEIFAAEKVGAMDFRRKVCIKRIRPSFNNDQTFVQMFIDEARTTSQLRHSNVVSIDDFGITDGHLWACMEWINGVDAARLLGEMRRRGRKMPVDVALYLVVEVLKGLEYAHAKRDDQGQWLKIVHRDVSPHNIMVSYVGEVKLTDFGIARCTSRLYQTQGDLVKGKVAYMAPEQAAGKGLDGRTDLFALGIVLYELLAGERPFRGLHDHEKVLAMMRGERAPLRDVRPEVAPDVEGFCDRLMAPRPDDRFRDATAALDAAQGIPTLMTGMRSLRLLMNELYGDAASVVVPRFEAPDTVTDASPLREAPAPAAIAPRNEPTVTRTAANAPTTAAPNTPPDPPPDPPQAYPPANASAPYAVVPVRETLRSRVWLFALVSGAAVAIVGVFGYAVVVRPPRATVSPSDALPLALMRDAGVASAPRPPANVPTAPPPSAQPVAQTPVAQTVAVVAPEAPSRERPATLAWVARPWANVTVHDETFANSSRQSVQLPAGSYRLVARHPEYGTITRRVRLRAGERKSVTLVFGAHTSSDDGT